MLQCLDRILESDRQVLTAESELAHLYLDKEGNVADTATLVARGIASDQSCRTSGRGTTPAPRNARAGSQDARPRTGDARSAHAGAAVAERLREDYGLDLATLDAPETSDETLARDQIDAEIAELRRKIAHIGNVNLDALAELEELEVRFAHLSEQHRDLSGAKQSLVEIIERINTDSRRLFAETLDRVRTNFQTLFRKLFGGGQADIVLDEGTDLLESGIEIVARPPGKEPRNISLLSGGEKTLTCVALLLAIFQYRPSPFCVLDEVDAALDEANIERFIGVLQEFWPGRNS